MPINFTGNLLLQEVYSGGNGLVSSTGRVVQSVHTTFTGSLTTNQTSGGVDFFYSNTITLANPNNKILVEWFSETRTTDWGDGVWNLLYMQCIHVQSGTNISYTGYHGALTFNIRPIHKVAIHTPGSIGPHSYKLQGWSYPGIATPTSTFNNTGWSGGDGVAHIRLTEIAA